MAYEPAQTFVDKVGTIHYLAGYWVDDIFQNSALVDNDGKFEAHRTSDIQFVVINTFGRLAKNAQKFRINIKSA